MEIATACRAGWNPAGRLSIGLPVVCASSQEDRLSIAMQGRICESRPESRIIATMALSAVAPAGYTYKSSPYSSHTLLVDALPPEGRGKRVLDIGCAAGYLAEILAGRGYEVVGIERPGGHGDSFPENVTLLEAALDRGLPPLPGKFDYVICGDIIEHLRDPASMLAQIGAVLEPDGRLVASVPNSGNLYFRLTVLAGRFPQDDKGLFDRTPLH